MIPAAFDYTAPSTVDEVIDTLREHGDEAKILAGGHSLLPLMKLRLSTPALLVDLRKIPGLSYIRDGGSSVSIGAMTTYAMLESSDLLRQRLPLLAQAAGVVGDMQVRNRGTIGGSLAHADPVGDLPTVATALGAQVIARGPGGERAIEIDDFFEDVWTNTLEPAEVITEVRFPYPRGISAQHYTKFRQRASDWAIVGVAVSLVRSNGDIAGASVVLANVGETPIRATGVEQALQGKPSTAETIRTAAARAADNLDPPAELRASAEYKRHLARVLTQRALESALEVQ